VAQLDLRLSVVRLHRGAGWKSQVKAVESCGGALAAKRLGLRIEKIEFA
jgi:hypothetical protein